MARKQKRTIRIGNILHTSGKVLSIGGTLFISLPKAWATEHDIQAGDVVVKVANSMLTVNPKPQGESLR